MPTSLQQLLTSFDEPTPEALIERYNLSQAQGVLYRASHVVITAHRNDPGEYKLLFRYVKLFGLMAYIEGDADHGFTLTIDGPTSLFTPSTRYGLARQNAPRLAACDALEPERDPGAASVVALYAIGCPLSPGRRLWPGVALSAWQAPRQHAGTGLCGALVAYAHPWRLEREVDLIPIPGSVMVPDFRLVHPDGRSFLLEIVGYWRPEYAAQRLRKCVGLDVTISFWPFLSASTWSALVSRLRICQPASCGLRTGYCPKPCWRC